MKISKGQNLNYSKKAFIVSSIMLPILFQYATFISGFTVGDLLLIISFLLLIIDNRFDIKKSFLFLIFYIVLQTLFLSYEGLLIKVTTSYRYIVYLIVIMLIPTVAKEKDYIFNILEKTSKFCIILLIVQYVALLCGYVLPGILTFLPLTDDALLNYSEVVFTTNSGRCMSVFAEPSHYAIYILLYLIYKLFEHREITMRNMLWPIITSISIVACSSFTGILCMAVIWIIKILLSVRYGQLSLRSVIIFSLPLVILYCVIFFSNMGSYLSNEEIYERQSTGRFSGFIYVIEQSYNISTVLFGNGMNDIGELEYLSGWPRLYFYYGVIGTIIYVLTFVSCLKRKSMSILVLILIAGLMVGTEMNFGPMMVFYMLILFSLNYNNRQNYLAAKV